MTQYILEHPFQIVLIFLAVALVTGPIRNSVVKAVAAGFNMIAAPCVAVCNAIRRFQPRLRDWISRAHAALTVKGEADDPHASWSGWDLVMPMLWASLFAILIASDLFLMDLRLAALLGIRPALGDTSVPVDLFMAAMYTGIALTFGFAVPELLRASLARRPWATLSQENRSRLLRVCFVCLGLTIGSAALLWIWAETSGGRGASLGEIGSTTPLLFWIFLVGPLIIASALSGWAALTVPGAIIAIALMLFRAFLSFVTFVLGVFVWTLDKVAEFFTAVFDVTARAGAGIINFFGSRLPKDWQPPRIDFDPRPKIGADVEEPDDEHRDERPSEDQTTHPPDDEIEADDEVDANDDEGDGSDWPSANDGADDRVPVIAAATGKDGANPDSFMRH